MLPPALVGLAAGWLWWSHRYVALAAWIVVALLASLVVSARSYQRRAHWP
jgi:hypothetical protein